MNPICHYLFAWCNKNRFLVVRLYVKVNVKNFLRELNYFTWGGDHRIPYIIAPSDRSHTSNSTVREISQLCSLHQICPFSTHMKKCWKFYQHIDSNPSSLKTRSHMISVSFDTSHCPKLHPDIVSRILNLSSWYSPS